MRRIIHVVAVVALASGVAVAAGTAGAAPAQPAGPPGIGSQVVPSGRRAPRDGGRLSSDLRADAGLPARSANESRRPAPRDASGRVEVVVEGPDVGALQQALADNGATGGYAAPGKIDAVVPAGRLLALSNDPRVTLVRSRQQFREYAGTVQSEGVGVTGASAWQTAGQNGSGVNVAIIDVGGFQGYDTELGDELPASVTKKNFCGSDPDVFDSTFTGDPHGTEVAAIVHDMAPSAGIALICAQTEPQLVAAQDFILGLNSDGDSTNDIRIVDAPWGDPIGGRGDGLGPPGTVDAVVRTLRQNNVLWVSSAGNEGSSHFGFSPAGPDLVTSPGDPNSFHFVAWQPNNYQNGIFVFAGETVTVLLRWDSWVGPAQDFDLYLTDQSGNIIADSFLDQTQGAPPEEGVQITNNTGVSQPVFAWIDRFSASSNPHFDFFALYPSPIELTNSAGSIATPANSPYSFTAGAVCYATGSLEPFSSQGPTIDGRVKPDITAPDGTSGQVTNSITPYGAANSNCTSGFTGTSASSPHVAGAAALVMGASPTLDAAQVESVLEARATDAGPAGFDNQFGWGRLTMGGAPPPAPSTPSGDLYVGISPTRVYDTRPGAPPVSHGDTPLGAGQTDSVTVSGVSAAAPAGASAVAVNLTVVQPTASGFLTLFPTGAARPLVASLVFAAGQTITIHATVAVGSGGQISIYNHAGSSNVGIDVVGYYATTPPVTGGGLTSFSPIRIYDTRPGTGAPPVSHGDLPLGSGETITLPFASQSFTPPGGGGSQSVPATATAVVLNVTAMNATASSFFTLYPDDLVSRPLAADMNFTPGGVRSNLIIAKIGTGGGVKLFNFTGTTDLAIELLGYFDSASGDKFVPLRTPVRDLDTRFGNSRLGGLQNNESIEVQERLLYAVPHTATAVIGTMTVVAPPGSGFVTAFPGGTAAPFSANIAYAPGQVVGNATITSIANDGRLGIFNHTSAGVTDVAYDLAGYFVP